MPATLDTPTLHSTRTDRPRSVSDWLADAGRLTLLAGPTALAFFAGGYFDGPRAWAGLAAWALVVVGAILFPRVLSGANLGARLALVALAALAGWTLLSLTWAPVAGTAYHDGQRVLLYTGVLVSAAVLLRTRGAQRAVEPALAAGALIVIGYGLSERLLPGMLHFARSVSAEGRLEQPLTYWNAAGEVAALGFVLATRVAGDRSRPVALRGAAAAAAPVLGLGLYISFSRGALFACVAGLVTLIVVAPEPAQARAIATTLAAAVLAVLAAAPFKGVTSLAGSASSRERGGAVVLVALVVIAGLAALAQRRWGRDASDGGRDASDGGRDASDGRLRLPARAPLLATLVICAGLGLAIVLGAHEQSAQPLQGGSARLVSLQSNRYAYWRVALRAFGTEPLRGVGAGGWAVDWLRWRPFAEGAQDAHSLEIQTLAELGLVGLALLAAFLAGVGLAARAAHRVAPGAAAGAVAGCVVWLAHSPLDWDWEMPAVTLIALILAGSLLALPQAYAAAAPEPATGRAARSHAGLAAPLRWLIAAGATALCAWFVLGAVQAHDENRATALIDGAGTPSPAVTSQILHLLDAAGTLNPDRDIALLRSQAQTRAGRDAAAVRTAQGVARAEPLNIDAWTVLAFAAQPVDPAVARLARAHQAALAPPVSPAP
ncbi:MAG TPA: O-antigen ligase family protein [Solirubrobacteraceae bacterium]|nr:O-antigen ligase family protein [Solirubrobacteraceae bacterium]